jgi:ABC-type sugar transport system ATPase subunit
MLEARGIRKAYGGVVALAGVDFVARPGSVHALLGENGAGKSTLVKVLVGAIVPDAGVLRLGGQQLTLANTADAVDQGVAVVSQELSLFPDLDILSNLFPMREFRRGPLIDRRKMAERARPVLDELGLDHPLETPVSELPLDQRQLLEIARALVVHPRVLVLDEPTSALHARESARLHDVLKTLRKRDVAVVYVSHHLEDVLAHCDEATIMRDGRIVLPEVPVSTLTVDRIVQHMLGDKVAAIVEERTQATSDAPHDGPQLRWEGITVRGELEDVSLEVATGSIVGVAGVAGSGYRTLLSVAVGATRPDSGRVVLPTGVPLKHGLQGAIGQGVAIVSGDRRRNGVMLDKPIWDNVAQVRSVALRRDGVHIRARQLRERAAEHVKRLGIKTPSVDLEVGMLSGGNQQKVVFAKWLEAKPSVLLLDDPTRGIDVGAKAEIYNLMQELSDQGAVQIVASSDPRELAAICDEVVVMYNGRVCARLRGEHLSAHTILEVMNTGVPPAGQGATRAGAHQEEVGGGQR